MDQFYFGDNVDKWVNFKLALTANQIRGLAAEYGVVFPLSIKALRSHLPLALEDAENALSPVMRNLLQTLYCDFVSFSEEIDEMTQSVCSGIVNLTT